MPLRVSYNNSTHINQLEIIYKIDCNMVSIDALQRINIKSKY